MSRTEGSIARLVEQLLKELGEDAYREGLERTPERVEKALRFLTAGYRMNVADVFNEALFVEEYDEMVVVKDIDYFSLCEHHLIPFFGKAHIAYMPRRKIVGLSKIPRLVEMFSRRLQVQERLTTQIAQAIEEHLDPRGVLVVIQAEHLCMAMRGIRKVGASTVTSAVRGLFRNDVAARAEAMRFLDGR